MPLGEIFIKWKPLSQVQQDLRVFQAYWLLHQPLSGRPTRNEHRSARLEGLGVGENEAENKEAGTECLSLAYSVSSLR